MRGGGMTHTELICSLEYHLKRLGIFSISEVYPECNFTAGEDFPIMDVWAYGHAASKLAFMGFEVKAQRSDLLLDIKKQKYTKYLRYCSRFYFAYELGLAVEEEIPPVAGIITYTPDKGWSLIRQARAQQWPNLDTHNFEGLLRKLIPKPELYAPNGLTFGEAADLKKVEIA
jgi:hypothetical protein